MTPISLSGSIRLGLPKGRMEEGVLALLRDAGIKVQGGKRAYRPFISLDEFEVKVLKPQNIIEMLAAGSRDIGFAGADWVAELDAQVVELLDTGLDPVRLVAAAPAAILCGGKLPPRRIVIASEYENLTKAWLTRRGLDAEFVRSYAATEVFPPEDADCIVDNTATGATLTANNLEIIDELMRSSTRLYANPKALEDPVSRNAIERFTLLLRSVLDARQRVMVEVNVAPEYLDRVVAALPAMRQPTISSLNGSGGYAVKAAVARVDLPRVIPEIKERGGTDIVVMNIGQLTA